MLKKLFKPDARWYVVMAIAISALLTLKEEGAAVFWHAIPICLTACAADFLIIFVRDKKVLFPLSALVSGLIISAALAPTKVFFIAPLCAILSKHSIRYSGRHIFNPAAFGLLAVNVLLKQPLSWWLATNAVLIVAFGIFAAYKIKKFSLILSFIAATGILLLCYSMLIGKPWASQLGIISPFFVFFMLPEPKTSPAYPKSKLLYGATVALATVLCFVFLPQYDFLVMGLCIGNIAGVFLRRIK